MKLFQQKNKYFSEEQRLPAPLARFWLLSVLLLVIAPHLYRQSVLIAVLCMAVVAWRFFYEFKGARLPTGIIKLMLTLTMLAVVFIEYRTFNGLAAGSALLASMLCMKLLELQTIRDCMVAIFIGYFLVVAGFLYDQSIASGVYLFVVVLALTASLIVLNHQQPLPMRASVYYLRLSGSMLLQALPMMLVLFLLFPRIPGPLWSLGSDNRAARTGLSDEMKMGEISNLADSNEVAFRVTFDGVIPLADKLYWRGPVLWISDGRNWERLGRRYPRFSSDRQMNMVAMGEPVSYTVTLEPHDKYWLFALDLPASLPEDAAQRFDYQLVNKEPVTELKRYQVISYLQYTTGPLVPALRDFALQLPQGVNQRTYALAEQWRAEGLLPVQLVERALNYFRDNPFYYSRQPPVLTSDSVVDQFLFDTRRGFCEHFAASFVTLMRAAGLPARIVTGYQGGEVNTLGDYLIVRQSDAHAWAEVWLEGVGWQRVDPTAVIPPERVESRLDSIRFNDTLDSAFTHADVSWLVQGWNRLGNSWDAVNFQWNNWVLGYGREKQRELLSKFGLTNIDWMQMGFLLFILLLLTVLLVAFYLFWRQAGIADPLLRSYQQFCDKLARVGVQRMSNEGPNDFACRASAALPVLSRNIRSITDAYIALRYHHTPSKQEIRQFRSMVSQLRVRNKGLTGCRSI